MQQQTSDNSGLNKLKSILFLGLSCNQTTILGCLIVWIILSRNEVSSFWHNITFVLCVAPFFMGDAVDYYVLGRIRLEEQNGWDDIRMTSEYKKRISKYFYFYRALSVLSSYLTVALMTILSMKVEIPLEFIASISSKLVAILGPILFINFAFSLQTIIKGIAPIIPQYKRQGLILRIVFVIIACVIWFYLLFNANVNKEQLANYVVFFTGILYFLISGLMHPLPAKGSLFESILRESIISQAKEAARERAYGADQTIDYNLKREDIEDASILSSDDKTTDIETSKKYFAEQSVSDAVITETDKNINIDSNNNSDSNSDDKTQTGETTIEQ